MKILLLEPYCGGSHRAWAEGYAAHSRNEVTLLSLPARFCLTFHASRLQYRRRITASTRGIATV